MAKCCVSRLFSLCLLQFGLIIGVYTAAGNDYYHYHIKPSLEGRSSFFTAGTKFEGLNDSPGGVRVRRYVPDPIAQLADNYPADKKTKFFVSPDGGSVQSHPHEQPVDNRKPDSSPPVTSVPDLQNHRDEPEAEAAAVHNKLSQTTINTSTIVSADFAAKGVDDTKPQSPEGNRNDGDDDDINIDKISDDILTKENITKKKEDHHLFYNSSFIVDSNISQSYWVDMNRRDDVKINHMLSKSHRRAATVKLSFDFPFYGHMVRNVTIATGGFLYTGDYVHSWLAATQYIAPLMANFDTSISNDSYIKYVDNGTAFTVQWEKVVLQDKPDSGNFTFQATLHSNGDIVFVYQIVPVVIESIRDDQHPVKVGLSDAYIIDRTIFFVRRKTIYEYHRVQFNKEEIKNWTVIYLNALPTCLDYKDCESCITAKIGFECVWCPGAQRCSTGMDRARQDWLQKECDKVETKTCEAEDMQQHQATSKYTSLNSQASMSESSEKSEVNVNMSAIVAAMFLIILVCGVAIWTLYAYSNPHSTSGQILIRYRPSQWSWRRGEARYTAATIHM